MPKEKEIHYFDEKIKRKGRLRDRLRGSSPADQRWRRQAGLRIKRFPKGLAFDDLSWDLKYFFGRHDDRWYASLFEQGKGKITGETTPEYAILSKQTINHVHDLMPDAKIIFFMRNPIERPWSVLDMGFRTKGESMESVTDEKFYTRLDNKRIRWMTSYSRTLRRWKAVYPEDQIFVGFLEDIHFFPEELLGRLYDFLGASTSADYVVNRGRIHSGQQSTIPTRVASHLADTYHRHLKVLSGRFGGYADFWLYCAEQLIYDPPSDERMPYPLWESSLWDSWKGSRKLAAQSDPLSSVLRRTR